MQIADRITSMPKYLFAEIDRLKWEAKAKGVDLINLGVGDPDVPTPDFIVDALVDTIKHKPSTHQYPEYDGDPAFRASAAAYLKRRFALDIHADRELVGLIGSKEGIAHFALAVANPGDVVLVPDPAYPVYFMSAVLAGAEPYRMPLLEKNSYLPDFSAIPADVLRRARLMYLNYPNNPTSAVADIAFFREAVAFAKQHNIVICHDNAYAEITFDGFVAPSILQVEGAKECCIELYSLSKPLNMTGWRVAFAYGHEQLISALRKVKTATDSGQFTAIQFAAMEGLASPDETIERMRGIYTARRDRVVAMLNNLGLKCELPRASLYVWLGIPPGFASSQDFAMELLASQGVIVSPGVGFGQYGEGYFRISLTTPDPRLDEGLERIRRFITSHRVAYGGV
ncbi:MAG: LL-diaminopimelate aminotransferase [Peptococcaceae bacterium]|nr:LL-diaminopimelate aminotransferase [Peptococcaceae bacterium]